MQNQKKFWDEAISSEDIFKSTTRQTDIAEEVASIIKPHSKILDLGCGLGQDDTIFAQAGHTVIATDFSEVAIRKCTERFKSYANLKFEILDMSKPFKFTDNEFDVVYASLSLHYFKDKITKQIFREIHRVLKPKGYLCFLCKSTNDKLYGEGTKIERDMFERNGHVRHFFSEDYTKSLLEKHFEVEKIESGEKEIYRRDSSFVKVIAHAVK
jgi:ubiquinone/menaquinone biosynthesis C-methylase UbiE